MRVTRSLALATVAAVAIAALASPAAAKPGKGKAKGHGKPRRAVTKIVFKLSDHELAVGETVSGPVRVLSKGRRAKRFKPLAGAVVTVSVDHVQVGTVTTDDEGRALVEVAADEAGEHVVKVRYAGDATHKKAQRAQGFEVTGTWFLDGDGDGFGDPNQPLPGLVQPAGSVVDGTDCDDSNLAISPGAVEDPLNGLDDDCDGAVDEAA